jgi:hypothetical protein
MGIHNTFIASFPHPKSLRIDDDGDDTDDECISPYTLPTAATHADIAATHADTAATHADTATTHSDTAATHADTEIAYMSTNAEDAAATIDDFLNDPIVMDHVGITLSEFGESVNLFFCSLRYAPPNAQSSLQITES